MIEANQDSKDLMTAAADKVAMVIRANEEANGVWTVMEEALRRGDYAAVRAALYESSALAAKMQRVADQATRDLRLVSVVQADLAEEAEILLSRKVARQEVEGWSKEELEAELAKHERGECTVHRCVMPDVIREVIGETGVAH